MLLIASIYHFFLFERYTNMTSICILRPNYTMMKQTILMALTIMVFFSSCSQYGQVVYIAPTSEGITTAKSDCYVFENADLKIKYSFWAEHGIMGFKIYNKTDHPLYIDWKKSSMINNGTHYLYYTNKTTSNFTAYGSSYGTSWLNGFGSRSSNNNSKTTGAETVVHMERISFVSPQSSIYNAFYNLTANIYFDVNNRTTKEAKVDGTPVWVSTSNFGINFRNYITYSDKETFETEKHVDNGFMVKKVYTMDLDNLGVASDGSFIDSKWENPECFYITNLDREQIFGKD